MPWRRDPRESISTAAAELAAHFGDALHSLALYGSAVGPGFRPDRSDVNLAVVAMPLEFAHLQRVAQWAARWRAQRFAVPLVLSTTELDRSRDVFPLELLDIRARHRTLAGADVFADVVVDAEAVRAECEREAKGKLLRLRALYVELAGSAPDVRALMLDSRKTFLHVVRGLLHLRNEPWDGDGATVIRAFERCYGCPLPVMADPRAERFGEYLREVETIADIADREAPTRA
jgi:hypothetical protein